MATKKPTATDIDDGAVYRVSLKNRVEREDGTILLPGQKVRVTGSILKTILDDVDDFGPAAAAS